MSTTQNTIMNLCNDFATGKHYYEMICTWIEMPEDEAIESVQAEMSGLSNDEEITILDEIMYQSIRALADSDQSELANKLRQIYKKVLIGDDFFAKANWVLRSAVFRFSS